MNASRETSVWLGIVALPIGILMLARLFDSAVLGWTFGLMLASGMVLIPPAVIIYLIFRMIRWALGKRRAVADVPVAGGIRTLRFERDSVHASDDAPSHWITVAAACTMRTLIAEALAQVGLPTISGGRATWVAETVGGQNLPARPIAVLAQEWSAPVFLLDPETAAASHFAGPAAGLRFKYLCQVSPDDVLADLLSRRPQAVTRASNVGADNDIRKLDAL